MKDQNCAYCVEGELLDAFGIKICELESSKVYLFKEQSHLGRVIVAHKKHVSELVELSQEELHLYFDEVAKVANVLHKLFQPEKVNYGAYGDTGHHLHFHLVPCIRNEPGREISHRGRIYRISRKDQKRIIKIVAVILQENCKVTAAYFSVY